MSDIRLEKTPEGYCVRLADGTGYRCAIGKGGIIRDKHEGDGGTPVGAWFLRRVVFRPDRVYVPQTELPMAPIAPDDGWCDDPVFPEYNRPVKLPFEGSHERMWRDDNLYDVVVILGHNDDPPVPGKGSAIFMHVAREGYKPTEGCVALALPDLLQILKHATPGDRLVVPDVRPA